MISDRRDARLGELCTCGREATVVFGTHLPPPLGGSGWCGTDDHVPLLPCRFCGEAAGHWDGQEPLVCSHYRLAPDSTTTSDECEAAVFLFTTRRSPVDLIAALRLLLTETVHIGWSRVWQESPRRGVLVELPRAARMAVFDLGAAGMAEPDPADPFSHSWTDESGEDVYAGRFLITAEGRHLLDLLEGK